MKLFELIEQKRSELSQEYRKVEFHYAENVELSKNSTRRQFNSSSTELHIEGEEINIHKLKNVSTLEFKENGSIVNFKVVPKGKRKSIDIEYYFLWKDVALNERG